MMKFAVHDAVGDCLLHVQIHEKFRVVGFLNYRSETPLDRTDSGGSLQVASDKEAKEEKGEMLLAGDFSNWYFGMVWLDGSIYPTFKGGEHSGSVTF